MDRFLLIISTIFLVCVSIRLLIVYIVLNLTCLDLSSLQPVSSSPAAARASPHRSTSTVAGAIGSTGWTFDYFYSSPPDTFSLQLNCQMLKHSEINSPVPQISKM